MFPLVFRYGGIIASAAHCQSRLDLLSTKWNSLWLSREFVDPEEAMRQWQEFTREQAEITSFQSATPVDRKLSKATQRETHAYWKNEADRLNKTLREATTSHRGHHLSDPLDGLNAKIGG